MKKTVWPSISSEEQDKIILKQARMIALFKMTETFNLIQNTIIASKKLASLDRQRSMKLQSTREMCLYHSGVEDGLQRVLDEIDAIEANGHAVEQKNKVIAQYEAQEEGI